MRRTHVALAASLTGLALSVTALTTPADASRGPGVAPSPVGRAGEPAKRPVAIGKGGAVTSVDVDASRIGLQVLKDGGNAVDAAVAMAAALGVTEPFSAGIGGGGYFMYRNARTGKITTLDGRETAPATIPLDAFVDPDTGETYPFSPDLVTSGVAVGTPGTLATWQEALDRWGTRSLRQSLRPATALARQGFVVDQTFHDQVQANVDRFKTFTPTAKLFLPDGSAPGVGEVFRNPDLAATYRDIAQNGPQAFYRGAIGADAVQAARRPPVAPDATLPAPAGYLTLRDLRDYSVQARKPITVDYRGFQVNGMGGSSSGGSTVGEILGILSHFPLPSLPDNEVLHTFFEASALAYADRAAYVGDRAFVKVPDATLLSPTYTAERACSIDLEKAAAKPVAAGSLSGYDGQCDSSTQPARGTVAEDHENKETTNLTVVDKWNNIVEYTLTIEQTGGSGIVVPGRGFLLNNELTDFSLTYRHDDPNRLAPGKRPRSSMSPTIITRGDRPVLALGSPGGSTIISTVAQIIVDYLDRDLGIVDALNDPRAVQSNTEKLVAEPGFVSLYGQAMNGYGHELEQLGDPAVPGSDEIGAATAIEFTATARRTAVAEQTRRGGGSAFVVSPR